MADLPSPEAQYGERIDVNDAQDVAYWMSELEVSKANLEAAVKAVGANPKDVRGYLARQFTRF